MLQGKGFLKLKVGWYFVWIRDKSFLRFPSSCQNIKNVLFICPSNGFYPYQERYHD